MKRRYKVYIIFMIFCSYIFMSCGNQYPQIEKAEYRSKNSFVLYMNGNGSYDLSEIMIVDLDTKKQTHDIVGWSNLENIFRPIYTMEVKPDFIPGERILVRAKNYSNIMLEASFTVPEN